MHHGRAARVLVFVLAIFIVWGHYTETGASSPADPSNLELTRTGWVLWSVPFFTHDGDGLTLHPLGITLGSAITLAAAFVTLRWWPRRRVSSHQRRMASIGA